MKVSEAIQQVKMEKPNGYSDTHCTVFLNEIEAIIQEFLGVPRKDWVEYRWEDSQQQDLIVPEPYSQIYISYLKAKIDYAQEEYESYGNNQAIYEDDMKNFKAWAIREGKIQRELPRAIKTGGDVMGMVYLYTSSYQEKNVSLHLKVITKSR